MRMDQAVLLLRKWNNCPLCGSNLLHARVECNGQSDVWLGPEGEVNYCGPYKGTDRLSAQSWRDARKSEAWEVACTDMYCGFYAAGAPDEDSVVEFIIEEENP